MTPAARHAAAIELLDRYVAGESAEKVLTRWARSNRYAGSKDRAAVRDLVFDIIRKRRSCAAIGGADVGRGLVLGYLRQVGTDPACIFTGEKYAPDVLSRHEQAAGVDIQTCPDAVRLDYQDWLDGALRTSLEDNFEVVMTLLKARAPVFVRVNARRASLEEAMRLLAEDQITATPHDLAHFALQITKNPRKLAQSRAYLDGVVELQDVASQAVVEMLNLPEKGRVLDYCAGGGGKALAMAARTDASVSAYDINAPRMQDLSARAQRAGVAIPRLTTKEASLETTYDYVLCDVPCTGSGAWRRAPEGKFALTPHRLEELLKMQAEILEIAAKKVSVGGGMAYATCSLLDAENGAQIDRFLASNDGFLRSFQRVFLPTEGGDGLFVAELKRV